MARPGLSDEHEAIRKANLVDFLAEASRIREERLRRATKAVEAIGAGALYGTGVLLTVEEAEGLAERFRLYDLLCDLSEDGD